MGLRKRDKKAKDLPPPPGLPPMPAPPAPGMPLPPAPGMPLPPAPGMPPQLLNRLRCLLHQHNLPLLQYLQHRLRLSLRKNVQPSLETPVEMPQGHAIEALPPSPAPEIVEEPGGQGFICGII